VIVQIIIAALLEVDDSGFKWFQMVNVIILFHLLIALIHSRATGDENPLLGLLSWT
jgi:hypothetical protein